MPRYGVLNDAYLGSWLQRDEPGGPMWALNLMKYRPFADYRDGRKTSLSGIEADDVYSPDEELRAVGGPHHPVEGRCRANHLEVWSPVVDR